MKCSICGKNALNCSGWLQRVNPLGVPGVWECRPGCNAPAISQEEALLTVIELPDQS